MSIVSSVRQEIKDQDHHEALIQFHAGWDGIITQDTILQGLMARYHALGKAVIVESGVRIAREDLKSVSIMVAEPLMSKSGEYPLARMRRLSMCALPKLDYVQQCYRVFDDEYAIWVAHPNLWHEKELFDVAKFTLDNFHH